MEEQEAIWNFWFPEDAGDTLEGHQEYWTWRMRGGADSQIIERFSETTERAAAGDFDDWAATPKGRLTLIIALDQFPRSVWRGTPRAYENDPKALAVALDGFDNGHFDALDAVWQKAFYQMPLGHCEGPNHLENLDRAVEIGRALLQEAPAHLRPIYVFSAEQPILGREVIRRFGRHPHRNEVLGRKSTPEELVYLETGKFPHEREFES